MSAPNPRLHWAGFLVLAVASAMLGTVCGLVHRALLDWWLS